MSGRCLGGVWEVPEGCLSDSGYCLGGYDVNSIDEHKIWIILISCVIFSRWPFFSNWSVQRPETENADSARKERSNQKVEENKLALKFNFT